MTRARIVRIARTLLASAIVAVVLLACMWCVVPGLHLPTMELSAVTVGAAVAAPEWAPVLLLVALVAGGAAVALAPRGRVRTIVACAAGVAIACTCFPVAAYLLDPSLPKVVTLARFFRSETPRLGPIDRDKAVVFEPCARARDDVQAPSTCFVVTMDVWHAPGVHRAPAMVEIHGGAWIFGDQRSDASHFPAVVAGGTTVIALDYRHAPKAQFPIQRDEIDTAIAYIAKHASELDVDPRRMVLVGRSAGAQLALLAAYRPQPIPFRGVAAFYAPTDLVAGAQTAPPIDPLDIRRALYAYLGPFTKANARYAEASPVLFARLHPVIPTLLVSGDRDELVDVTQQRTLASILRATPGDRVETYELPWSNHAFDDIPRGMGEQIGDALLDRWMRSVVPPDQAGSATPSVTTPTKISP
jgi:acetyl esterase/lipase